MEPVMKETRWARRWNIGCWSITVRRWTVGFMVYVEYCGFEWLHGGRR